MKKIDKKIIMLILSIFLTLILIGSVSAAGPAKQISSTSKIGGEDCSSILVQVSDNQSVYSYRRDASKKVTLNIKTEKWYGKKAVKEYKTSGRYFTHSIVTADGWYVGIGGSNDGLVNQKIEAYSKKIIRNGKITSINKKVIQKYIRSKKIGHYVIKNRYGDGFAYIYFYGRSKTISTFKLKPREYMVVANNPQYYKKGNYKKYSSNPVNASIKLAASDKYGINRRNIITYYVKIIKRVSTIKIYASRDTGKLSGRKGSGSDPIRIFGKYKTKFRAAPSQTYIGMTKYTIY